MMAVFLVEGLKHGWIECVLNVLYPEVAFAADGGHDVETDGQADVEVLDDGNIVVGSGKDNSYGEYDNDGNLIRRFDYSAKKYAYRVFKYSYDNLFVNEK